MWPVAFPSDNPGPFWPCDHIDIYRPYHRGSHAHLPVEQPLCADRWTGSRAPGKSPGCSEAPAVACAALDAVQKWVICQSLFSPAQDGESLELAPQTSVSKRPPRPFSMNAFLPLDISTLHIYIWHSFSLSSLQLHLKVSNAIAFHDISLLLVSLG